MVLVGMGFELVGLIVASVMIGQILDEKFGTKGLLLLALTISCLVSWMVHLVYLLKRLEKTAEQDSN
jgi:F0F1-type ATP synthase assembly protein I